MDEDLFAVFDSKPSTKADNASKKGKTKQEPTEEEEPSVDDLLQQLTSGKRSAEEASGDEEEETKKFKVEEEGGVDDAKLAEQMPRIQVHTIDTIESCVHEVCVPPDQEYIPLVAPTRDPPKQYPFVLDPFQKEAVLCLESNQSVLVSAHTSAGKTVVAEYAIALSLRDKQRVIYTTPIKALSNQKYREFSEEFQDVGLMTGDVTINPSASCLIMTTEILRSMLYRGSEVMREVAWVVFDEIHYMRDKSRGYVWEETIILLPDSVHYVFLSATIPNARQFAEWITYLHKQPCHVVYTDYRPTPLQHYIYPSGGDGIHLVVDEQGNFREDNFSAAMAGLAAPSDAARKSRGPGGKPGSKEGTNVYKIIKMVMERNLAPVIVFSFSKKECEAYALQMAKLDFNTGDEKKLVEEVFNNAMDVLSEEDRQLPQVEHVLPLLRRGIGIHHGGLLPILKETIEILFGEGLIKALFATETFAMGLNMPARTVLFTGCRKFDGKDVRWLSSGEYIQMSGRAGRRGKDDKGIVILMVDENMSPAVGKNLVKGQADPLNSAFHLTYNMVLNLLRVEEINPEYMLERSFFQFQNYAAIPGLCDRVKKARFSHDSMTIEREPEVAAYWKLRQQLDMLKKDFQKYITLPKYIVPFLNPGRVVHVQTDDKDFGWCIVINYKKEDQKKTDNPLEGGSTYVVDVLMHVSKETAQLKETALLEPPPADQKGEMVVVPVLVHLIHEISAVRLKYPQDLRPLDNRMIVLKTIKEMKRRFPTGIPRLDAVKDMGIKDREFVSLVDKIESFERRLFSHPLHDDPRLDELYNQYVEKMELSNELKAAKLELRRAKSLLQMDELKCRKRVLRRLGYCTAAGVIEVKGRVACELSSADELLITEMIFNGMFNDLSVPQSVALMSCFTFDEKSNDAPKLQDQLSGALRQMQELARRIARVSVDSKLELDEESYVGQFKPAMMDVVNAWCQGSSFAELCKMTDAFEGSIIRCMRRLEELLRQMVQAAKGIGNTDLENKFSEGIRLMKRDIVFAASLYL
ncbi:exosome RNA helicase MTR4-like [Amphibalanus amphitrite]|uniref:exosome RNA helicase MTR4-like n=1 Tax=Amphibalanus amphitrite TaxID=1232801 RepID=UPI001C9143E9|nr:exosome RNA helicase MTR4-like [Amphibalanus amphitrite]XP_043209435.1 exosome RNA helicase MTR4-like [Amphibalanus amphitrite]XP_043236893.1 exosome RNA helicase MTR4-like [Amphibalanus amphitrite]